MRIRAGTASTGFTRTWPGTGTRSARSGCGAWPGLLACDACTRGRTRPDGAGSGERCGLVNLVGRDFVPGAKDQLWYGDITYIFTMSGWAYLATVIDGYYPG